MRGTIIDAWYEEIEDDITESCICKETKYGTFTSYARPTETDKDIANSWDGFRFAETKCDIQAYKTKAKMMRERAKGIKHACDVVSRALSVQNKNFTKDETYQKFYKQYKVAMKDYYKAKEQYEIMRDSYSGFCEQIIKQRRKIRNEK